MSVRSMSVLLLGVACLVAGCGGSKKSASSATTTAAAAAPTTTAVANGSTTQSRSPAPAFASAHNCLQLAELSAKVAQTLQPTTGDLHATIMKEQQVLQAMANAAPTAIRGDFQTFATAFGAYVQAVQNAGIKVGAVPTAPQIAKLVTAAKAFSVQKVQNAERHLAAWARQNCGGVTSGSSGG